MLHHLVQYLGDHRHMVLLTGYQAPGTRGAALVKGSGSSALDRSAATAAKSKSVRFCPLDGGAPVTSGIAVVHVTYSLTQTIAQL